MNANANAAKRRALSVIARAPLARALAVAAAALVATGGAQAAVVMPDVSEVISVITSGVALVSSIGIAILSLVVVIKLFKWVQRVL
ncbi:virion coat protein B [Acidovorax sp. 69]|uniref:major capsid protein n=1 Tax=Acidovorax sp. 69 TaxID=2035202 RepID=UPI000C23E367|nr:major capsid protein [Acidovorax sp. 69]PJI97931.1 virion coat protein B [Acidovorax sp. 69]